MNNLVKNDCRNGQKRHWGVQAERGRAKVEVNANKRDKRGEKARLILWKTLKNAHGFCENELDT